MRNFLKDKRGAVTAATIVALAVGFLLVAILVPISMTQLVNANTTGWDTSVKTIFTTVLPILMIVGIAIKYIPRGKE
jgi:hypothetical protein